MEETPDPREFVEFDGEGWAIQVNENDDETVLTATKSFSAAGDATFRLTPNGNPMAQSVSYVSSGGYREVWSWIGESQEGDMSEMREMLGSTMKEEGVTVSEAELDTITESVAMAVWKAMFGPNDPLIAMFMHQDRMERQFKIRTYEVLVEALTDAGVAEAEKVAVAVVKKIPMDEAGADVQPPDPMAEPSEDDDDGGMIAVNVRVEAVGKTYGETNGERNPVDGTIEWSFYPEACAFEDLELTVTYR